MTSEQFKQMVADGRMVRRADGTYVAKEVSPTISTGSPGPANVRREFGPEVAAVFFRADSIAEYLERTKDWRN